MLVLIEMCHGCSRFDLCYNHFCVQCGKEMELPWFPIDF